MNGSYDVIKSPLVTEKLQRESSLGVYGFLVNKKANKIEIRKALKDIYKVDVIKVNVINMPGKTRRLRFKEGRTPSWKKAVVRLKKGQTIDLA